VGLAVAAEALEAGLRRYEDLAEALGRERLDSEKNLRRAAQALLALHDADARLAEQLAALVAAIGAARERQQASAVAVQERAELIRVRSEALRGLMAQWEALGRDANELTQLAQEAAVSREANGADGVGSRAAAFGQVDQRLTGLAERAQGLIDAAQAVDFGDLARLAEGLRAQVLAARNKLRLARGRE
jgi:hypothetical protein